MADSKKNGVIPPDVPDKGDEGAIADLTPPTRPRVQPESTQPTGNDDMPATVRPPKEPEPVLPASVAPPSPLPPTRPREPSTVLPVFKTPNVKMPVQRASLENERILRDAQRVEWNGAPCPTLGGIPLIAKLGEGGMGAVYFGIHPRLGAHVAVKVLPYHLAEKDPTLVDRFVREAQVAANVRSAHLVHVVDVNQDAGLYFLVMEYVCGQTGAKLLVSMRKLGQIGFNPVQAIDTVVAASLGLKAAHSLGVIHRDIKPDNIIIPYSRMPNDEGFNELTDVNFPAAKLMDLGLARVQTSSAGLTVTQSTMGTPGYMAPEQSMDAKSADQRSDIFSMGATLYALLAGRSPFQRESQMKTLFATVHDPPTPLKNYRQDIHNSVLEVIEKAMAKEPSQRHSSVDAFLAELRAARDAAAANLLVQPADASAAKSAPKVEPISELPAPVSQASVAYVRSLIPQELPQAKAAAEAMKWRKRQRMAIAGAMALCMLLVGGVGYLALRRPALSEQQLKLYRNEHDRYIQQAHKLADAGDFNAARTDLEFAERLGLEEPAAQKALVDARNFLVEAERDWTRRYQQQLVAFDAIIESQALENAPAALEELKKFAPLDGSDNPTIAVKEQALKNLQGLRAKEDEFAKALDKAAELEPDAALAKLDDLYPTLKEAPLKNSKALLDLRKHYLDLVESKLAAKNAADRKLASEEQKRSFDAALADADKSLTPEGDLAAAGAKLNEAARYFPADEGLKERREKLESLRSARQREVRIATALRDAGASIDKQAWDDAEMSLKIVDELSPGNKDAEKLREKSHALQAEALNKATEEQRQKKAAELRQQFDALLNEGNLAEAETKLNAAGEIDNATPEFKQRQEQLSQKKLEWKQRFEGLLKDAEVALTDDARLAEAGKKLDEAAQMSPDDKRVASLREKFQQSKDAALARERARQKSEKYAATLKALEPTLPAANDPQAENKMAAVREKFAQLARGNEHDPATKAFNEFLGQRQTEISHIQFEAMLKKADAAMEKDLAGAEKTYATAKELFPNDPLLRPVRQRLDVRQRFASALNSLDDMLQRRAKIEDLEAQFDVADKLFPKDPRLESYRQQLGEIRKQTNFFGLLNTAQQRMKDDNQLVAAQAALDEAAKLYPSDNRLIEARQALGARQAAVQRRIEQQNYMQKLQTDVDGLMATDAMLAEAESRVNEAARIYPGDPMLARLRGRIQNRRAELHPTPTRQPPPPIRETPPIQERQPTPDTRRPIDDVGEQRLDK